MSRRRDYYNNARDMARTPAGLRWLLANLRDPSPRMTPCHLQVIRAAIRDIHPTAKF